MSFGQALELSQKRETSSFVIERLLVYSALTLLYILLQSKVAKAEASPLCFQVDNYSVSLV